MMLLIDAGNTRVKWALAAPGAAPGQWQASGAALLAELEQLAPLWAGLGARAALVANVAGPEVASRIAAALPARLAVHWFASTERCANVTNGYREPARLGCDRFAAAIGAHALFPAQDLVVATCGTATTIDAVRADGLFIGGMILPGLALMQSSLARNTAQLPQVTGDAAAPLFADNTFEAIRSGCLSAQAGAIERACSAFDNARCILAGGAAAAIAPRLRVPHVLVEQLVLVGLAAAAASLAGDRPC